MARRADRTAAREQSRARYPDDEGYVERDGVRVFYEVYGEGEPTVMFVPTVGDRPLATLEDADPVPRAPLPRARRSTGAATAGPTARRARTRTASPSSRSTHSPSSTQPRRSGPSWSRCRSCAALWGVVLAAEHPERVERHASHRRRQSRLLRRTPSRDVIPFEEAARHRRRLGEVQRALTGCATTRGFLEFFMSQCFTEPHSTKQIEDASAGGSKRRPRRSSLLTTGRFDLPTASSCASSARAFAARCSSSTATRMRSAPPARRRAGRGDARGSSSRSRGAVTSPTRATRSR